MERDQLRVDEALASVEKASPEHVHPEKADDGTPRQAVPDPRLQCAPPLGPGAEEAPRTLALGRSPAGLQDLGGLKGGVAAVPIDEGVDSLQVLVQESLAEEAGVPLE